MSIAEIKNELKSMEDAQLDEVASLILQLRRARDPRRKDELADLIDGNDWVVWKKDED